MPTVPETFRKKINDFEDVKVLTNKDLYNKLGSRVPKMPKSGGIALFGLSKVTSAAKGEELVIQSLEDEILENKAKATSESNKTSEPAKQEQTEAQKTEVSAS